MDFFTPRQVLDRLADPNAGFNICKFKDKTLPPRVVPHYHVIISLGNNQAIVICIITSELENRKNYYERIAAKTGNATLLDSLIALDKTKLKCFTLNSIVDCHQAECLTLDELHSRIDYTHPIRFQLEPDGANRFFDEEQKESIVKGILNSSIVRDIVKQEIRTLGYAS